MLKFARNGRSSSGTRIPMRILEDPRQRDFSPVGVRTSAPEMKTAANANHHSRSSSAERRSAMGRRPQLAFDRDVTPRELRQLHQQLRAAQLLQASPGPPVVRRADRVPTTSVSTPSPSSSDHSDYQQLSSGLLCRGSNVQQPSPQLRLAPMTPTLEKLSSLGTSDASPPPPPLPPPKSALKRVGRYTFHRDVERLVAAKLDLMLPAFLDTSSESGYGSDHDSLASRTSTSSRESSSACSPPPLPKR